MYSGLVVSALCLKVKTDLCRMLYVGCNKGDILALPKKYYELEWAGNQERNEIFVAMPLNDDAKNYEEFKKRFDIIKKLESEISLSVKLSGDPPNDGSIMDRIFDYLVNSKFLIFDLSNDPRYNCPNPNVMYELGIAVTIRQPEDIIILKASGENNHSGSRSELLLPFDVKDIRVVNVNSEEKMLEEVKKAIKTQEEVRNRLTYKTSRKLDVGCIWLMKKYGVEPDGYGHMNSKTIEDQCPEEFKPLIHASLSKLLELGMVETNTDFDQGKDWWEYAYWWTPFSERVMKELRINKRAEPSDEAKQRNKNFEKTKNERTN